MKHRKKLTAVLMSFMILGSGLTELRLPLPQVAAAAEEVPENGCLLAGTELQLYGRVTKEQVAAFADSDVETVAAMPGCVLPENCSEMFQPFFYEELCYEYDDYVDPYVDCSIQTSWLTLSSVDLSNADASGVRNMTGMFSENPRLQRVIMPKNCNEDLVWDSLCYGCGNLTSVTLPDNVTGIGKQAFYNCVKLTGISIPGSVKSIGFAAFHQCSGLTDVQIGNGVIAVDTLAFYRCTDLTDITIPDSVTSIGSHAFSGCRSLSGITIPESVTSISVGMFAGCESLGEITIPDSVTSVESAAFSDCSGLTGITIPDSVTSIGDSAFYRCEKLTDVSIPDSVTRIGIYAFHGCSDSLKISGFAGSYAEQYADINEIPFVPLKTTQLTKEMVTLRQTDFSYEGRPVKVGSYISVRSGDTKLKYDTDFTLSYADNTAPGTASVTVTGKGKYIGSVTLYYTITPPETLINPGDTDCSGDIGIADAILLAQIIAEDQAAVTVQGLANSDLNGDGFLTAADLSALLRVLAGVDSLPD